MAELADLRTALAQTIDNGTQSTVFVYADVADIDQLPAVLIEPTNADYTEALSRGTDCWWFNVYILCSRNDATIGQTQLDGLVSGSGPDSIRAAVYNKPDLGLTNDVDAMVMKMLGYGGTFQDASIQLVGAILKVRVYTDGI